MAASKKSYNGRSVKELENIRATVAVHLYDNDFLDRGRARNEIEKIDKALMNARKREKKQGINSLDNPGDVSDALEQAEELARGFHGRENLEALEIEEKEIYRSNLAFLGSMLDVEVFFPFKAGEGLVTVPFEDVMLGASPDRKQLYFVGDTSLPDDWLQEMVGGGWDKDKVLLGFLYSISYFADKHHLTGPKQQAKGSEYIHCFGEQTFKSPASFKGVWKLEEKLASGVLPQLVYSRLCGGLEIIGGIYEIRDEGIWD